MHAGLPLRIRHPDGSVKTVPLPSGSTIKIGRAASCDIPLEDTSLSRIHAVIEVSGGAMTLLDLGSANGTEVNGRAVTKAPLQIGDVIRVGNVTIELGASAGMPAAPGFTPAPTPAPQRVAAPAQAPPTSGSNGIFIAAILGMVVIAIGVAAVLIR
jgi:pSer/pThr/pTyr-binding forkhead associated (FHA) protein